MDIDTGFTIAMVLGVAMLVLSIAAIIPLARYWWRDPHELFWRRSTKTSALAGHVELPATPRKISSGAG